MSNETNVNDIECAYETAVSYHRQVAGDQLHNADDLASDHRELFDVFLTGAKVHALLAIAAAIQEGGMAGWSAFDAAAQLKETR
jgi:hypothetical protein